MMYAIEFETDIEGDLIRLPSSVNLNNRHVKVIVLASDTLADRVREQEASGTVRRRPAKVPPIRFVGDVMSTVPATSWDIS